MVGTKAYKYLEYIGEEEVDELQHSWLDVTVIIFVFYYILYVSLTSFSIFVDVHLNDYAGVPLYSFDRGKLEVVRQVSDLEVAVQKYQAIVKDLETRLHKSECELTRAMRAIDNDQVDFQEKSNELNGQIDQLTKDHDDAMMRVGRLMEKLKEARLNANRCSAEWFKA
ncbi:hypothetical protein BVRB_5g109400 [Beta vulgaris subsp. vulgaris]|nr:hypothetical protein BVRB_5g109400 [Beta vulgaris subsp. vulgaris]